MVSIGIHIDYECKREEKCPLQGRRGSESAAKTTHRECDFAVHLSRGRSDARDIVASSEDIRCFQLQCERDFVGEFAMDFDPQDRNSAIRSYRLTIRMHGWLKVVLGSHAYTLIR